MCPASKMKNKMNTKYKYTVKDRGLQKSPNTVVTIKWHRGKTTTSRVGSLSRVVQQEGLVSDFPIHAHVDGVKTCVNPCVIAKTFKAAALLSALADKAIAPGDGLSLLSQSMALKVKEELAKLHANMDEFVTGWRIASTQPPKPSNRDFVASAPTEDQLPW